jgi:hypothetical protein
MGQVYQCSWRICWEINVFSRFKYHILIFIFVTCLLTASYRCTWRDTPEDNNHHSQHDENLSSHLERNT